MGTANSRVNSASWAKGDLVTATQINALDVMATASVNRNSTASGEIVVPFHCLATDPKTASRPYAGGSGSAHLLLDNDTTSYHTFELPELVNGQTLTAVKLTAKPAGGHGAQPSVLPALYVYKINGSNGTGSSLGSTTYTWVDIATYEGGIVLSVSGLTEVIDKSTYRYIAIVRGEASTNSVAGTELISLKATMTINHAEGGTDLTLWKV